MLSSKTINICLTTVPGGRWSAVKGVPKHHAVRISIIYGGSEGNVGTETPASGGSWI